MQATFEHEQLREGFSKWKFIYGTAGTETYFHSVKHRIAGVDLLPHSHPWPFTSFLLSGWYMEKVYHINEDGTWQTEIIDRKAFDPPHHVEAATIHQIIAVSENACWTEIIPDGDDPIDWYLWKFDSSGIWRRREKETEFKIYNPC